MIEGARALPWLEYARKKDPKVLDCNTCQKEVSLPMRRAMGCGFLPLRDPSHVWKRRELGLEYCAGYTTSLPDVQDAADVYIHHQVGALTAAAGDRPAPALLDLLAVLKVSSQQLEAHVIRNPEKGNR